MLQTWRAGAIAVAPLVVLASLWLVAGPSGAAPATGPAGGVACSGFAGCSVAPYTTHGYQNHEWNSYWRMDAGDECTNYVAYVESTVYHVATPSYLLGDAESWPYNAAAHGAVVNGTPSVGAVAEWDGGSPGIPYPGHVAVVEEVGAGWIAVSQQHISSDADGYNWTIINPSNPGSGWQAWPTHFIHFTGGSGSPPPRPPRPGGGTPAASSLAAPGLVSDGGFETGDGGGWHVAAHSHVALSRGSGGTTPYEGRVFAATSATAAGGGIFESLPLAISPGQSFCADAEVVTVGAAPGAHGAIVLWLAGGAHGAATQSSSELFGPLPGRSGWHEVSTCLTAVRPHTLVRVQIMPFAHDATLGVDAVDLHRSLASDGGFDSNDSSGWSRSAKTSGFAIVPHASGTTSAYEGDGFAATNTPTTGGGILEDVKTAVAAGRTYCVDAEVVTVGKRTGAHGALALWFLGGAHGAKNGLSLAYFGPLAGGDAWTPTGTCLTATAAYSQIRVQFYDSPGTPTLGIDAVDLHASLVSDGDFTPGDGGGWHVAPHSNFAVYRTPRPGTGATRPYSGGAFAVTNTTTAGGGIYQDVKATVVAGESYCASAEVVTAGAGTGARGVMALWFTGGGGKTQGAAVAFGPLAGNSGWAPVTTCLTATSSHDDIRVQFYPAPHSPTLAIDTVDVR